MKKAIQFLIFFCVFLLSLACCITVYGLFKHETEKNNEPLYLKENLFNNVGYIPNKPPLWSKEDIECMQDNIYYEARYDGAPIQEWYEIAHVVMKRKNMGKIYPDDICEVVYQEDQFSWSDAPYTIEEYDRYILAEYFAKDFLKHYKKCDEHNPQFDHYYAHDKVTPKWVKNAIATKKVGKHTFVQLYADEMC